MKPNQTLKLKSHTTQVEEPLLDRELTEPEVMEEKEIQPPSYVWERIAKVLDEQDNQKAVASSSFLSNVSSSKRSPNSSMIVYCGIIMLAGALILTVI